MLKKVYQYFKQILVGKVCLACCQSNKKSSGLCKICEHSIYPYAVSQGCQYCGHPILGHSETKVCATCHEGDKKWDQLTICYHYQATVKQLLWQYKFHHDFASGKALADLLVRQISLLIEGGKVPKPDVLIPVPIHLKRRRQRGFNQTEYFASELSKALGVPVDNYYVERVRHEKAQAKLSRVARLKNMQDAFQMVGHQSYQHIAVVEDIITTESTMTALVEKLSESGQIQKISVWCLAKNFSKSHASSSK